MLKQSTSHMAKFYSTDKAAMKLELKYLIGQLFNKYQSEVIDSPSLVKKVSSTQKLEISSSLTDAYLIIKIYFILYGSQ